MDQFTPQNIGCALVIGIVLFYAIREYWAWCDRVDNEWAERNPPDQDEIAAEHVEKRLPAFSRAEYDALRHNPYWNCKFEDIQNNSEYVPRGIENSRRYAAASKSEGGQA